MQNLISHATESKANSSPCVDQVAKILQRSLSSDEAHFAERECAQGFEPLEIAWGLYPLYGSKMYRHRMERLLGGSTFTPEQWINFNKMLLAGKICEEIATKLNGGFSCI